MKPLQMECREGWQAETRQRAPKQGYKSIRKTRLLELENSTVVRSERWEERHKPESRGQQKKGTLHSESMDLPGCPNKDTKGANGNPTQTTRTQD